MLREEEDVILLKFNEYITNQKNNLIENDFANTSYSEVLKMTLAHVIVLIDEELKGFKDYRSACF